MHNPKDRKQNKSLAPLQAKMDQETTGKSMAPPPFAPTSSPLQAKMEGGEGPSVMQKMESSFGTDFSDVNIHENSSAATEVGAKAFAQGNDVHFAPGQFKPDTKSGQELLGHELSHVVQQRNGDVKSTGTVNGMAVNNDASLENEADKMGALAAEGKSTGKSANGTKQLKSEGAPMQGFQLSETDQELYPRLKSYLQRTIQDILNNRRIMRGLQRYGQLSRADVEAAVTWGQGPLVNVTQLGDNTNGSFTPNSNSETLNIDTEIVEQLQNANRNDHSAAILLFGSTLLHEFTHYGDDQDGVDYTDGHGEEGQAFEEYAYGQDIDNLEDAQTVIDAYRRRRGN